MLKITTAMLLRDLLNELLNTYGNDCGLEVIAHGDMYSVTGVMYEDGSLFIELDDH